MTDKLDFCTGSAYNRSLGRGWDHGKNVSPPQELAEVLRNHKERAGQVGELSRVPDRWAISLVS